MRKKVVCTILTAVLVMGLTACSGNTGADAGSTAQSTEAQTTRAASQTTEAQPQETQESVAEEAETEETEAAAAEAGRPLIAYFSWSGNTEALAGMIQEHTGGDLFEITPAVPYTDDYNALLEQAQDEQGEQARPELASQVENWDDYDVIFVGYPNWWGDTPMAVLTFLESYDFHGKTLIPFCTHGSGGFGRSLSSVESSAAGAEILEGFERSGSSVAGSEAQVGEWLSSIGMAQ